MEKENKETTLLNDNKSWKGKDILILFTIFSILTLVLMTSVFITFINYKFIINIDISKLANTMNICIVIIGSVEGIRSISKTAVEDLGMSEPVPKYKLKFLFVYIIIFTIVVLCAVFMEYYIKRLYLNDPNITALPNFAINEMLNGLISNVISYLIARHGYKVVENVNLSSLPFFKFKH